MRLLVVILAFFAGGLRAATPPQKPPTCSKVVAGNSHGHVHLIPSGRESPEMLETYTEAIRDFFGPGGLVETLGLANPSQIHELTPSGQLSVLASLGRHAVVHWHDGMQISSASQSAAGVLEFVTPGLSPAGTCPTCRAFYSDTTKEEHQISVILHVIGHNDFATHSMFAKVRPGDPITESLALSNYVSKLYQEYDHDEVSRYYQWLLSLSHMQDLTRGSFEAPENFDPAKSATATQGRVQHAGNVSAYPNPRHPGHQTASVLQAIVANLPATVPAWKRELARRFERMERVLGFYTSNKIMNEGWATLMQEMLVPYTKYRSTHHLIEFGDLLQYVSYPKLDNPYYFGLQCWRRIRIRFNARPEIQGLSMVERDRAFIKYAHEEIIATMSDHEFIRYALDEQWIYDNKLFLSRPALPGEYDRSLPQPTKPNQEQKIILSRDPKRVADYLARKLADRRFSYPQIRLNDFNGFGRGVVDLRHDVVEQIPLKRQSAAQTLFVLSQVMEKPVSLVTVASSTWIKPKIRYTDHFGRGMMGIGMPPRWPVPNESAMSIFEVRYEVAPNGKVQVFRRSRSNTNEVTETLDQYLTEALQESVDEYRLDMLGTDNDGLSYFDRQKYLPTITPVIDSAMAPGMHTINHAPTAAHALLEFSKLLESRLLRSLQLAASGKLKFRTTSKGVRLKVLPTVPEFELDRGIMEALREKLPPAPVDSTTNPLPLLSGFFGAERPAAPRINQDDNSDVNSGNGRTGDRRWGDRKQKGKGQGDPEDGDPEDGDDPDVGVDSGEPKDPTEVEVPHDLFARFVAQYFRLPNLKHKVEGDSDEMDRVREGSVRRPSGEVNWVKTLPAAINYAIDKRRRSGRPWQGVSQMTLIKEGLPYLRDSDYITSDHEVVPMPNMKAVVVINLDLTGSMWGEPTRLAKKWAAFLTRLIRLNYKEIDIRYVGYSDDAKEFSEKEIWKTYFGGGNTDSTAFILDKQILAEKKYVGWDKYVVNIGDGGSNDMAVHGLMDELYKICQFVGWVRTTKVNNAVASFIEPIKERAQRLPWFGYSEFGDETEILRSIGEFFKSELMATKK